MTKAAVGGRRQRGPSGQGFSADLSARVPASRGTGLSPQVVEVDRPNRQSRRRTGKSDPADAIEAARAALSGRAHGAPKAKDGNGEAIRALFVAKRSARDTRIKTLNQIRHLGFTAPEELRECLAGLSRTQPARPWRVTPGPSP
jgi:hypothetical protein